MPEVRLRYFLPALMGSLHQQRAEGELVLEQNDGTRRLYWRGGDLVYLRSDAVGEQFGNFLIRRGVLDMAALKELLADGEGSRMGDRVVQSGLMTVAERDKRLHELLGSVLLHAMEHPILKMAWMPGVLEDNLSGDLQFWLDHRRLVWDTFQSAKVDLELVEMFQSEPDWRWEARADLLESLSDLSLTPTLAYALSLLGSEPLGYETISSLSGLSPGESARLVATLWALGGLNLVRGDLPLLPRESAPPAPAPEFPEPPEPVFESIPVLEPEAPPEPILLLEEEDFPPPRAHTPRSLPPPPPETVERAFNEPTPSVLPLLPSKMDEESLPSTDRAHHLLVKAKSYVMQNRTSEAIRALEQSIKLDGDSPAAYEAWLLLGRLRLTNPAWSTRAVEALQVASRIRPRAAEPWALMGELYHRKGFRANAQGCFRRALELDPSVAVPSDCGDQEGSDAARSEGGLMGRLRSMLGREKG
ncbi:tetratricopeptide repeat protein [Geothrix paludis]|uniref:tetratricopeptide repeat protein n=1 Tax=Geothrix paludis TaxID=2922722 RepID=UPI001FAC282C